MGCESWEWGPSKFPTIDTSVRKSNTFINLQITDPPAFRIAHFESYRRDLLFWRGLHAGVDDSTLLTTMLLKCTDSTLKSMLTSYLEKTRGGVRSFGGMMDILDKEFARTSHEHALGKLNIWSSFERKEQESLRGFWLRYEKLPTPWERRG